MTPTQRTRAELKRRGITSQIVERWNSFAKVRQDLFGVIDIVALMDGIFGIQCTSGSNHAARVEKSKAEPALKAWLMCGGGFEVWSWAKRGAKGKRKLWTLRVTTLTLRGGEVVANEFPVPKPELLITRKD